MGNKSSNPLKPKSTETRQYNFNAVRNQPMGDQLDAILSSASKQQQQTVLPKISLVTSITSETLFAGNTSIEEDVSSYKDAENERDENLLLVSECSDSVNAPDLPLDSNTLDSFCMRFVPEPGAETTCSLSSNLDQLTSECVSNGDTSTGFFARTHEIGLEEIKLLRNRQRKKQTFSFKSKFLNDQPAFQDVHLEYLALEFPDSLSKKFPGSFSKLFTNKSLSTTVIDANLLSILKPGSKLKLLTNKRRNVQAKPENHLNESESFKGHLLISKLLSSIDDDHYLKLLISQTDLQHLMNHVANYLLSIGVICPESNRKREAFMMDHTYQWAHTRLNGVIQKPGSHSISIEHLAALEESKNGREAKLSKKIKELEEIIVNLSKEISYLKSSAAQNS